MAKLPKKQRIKGAFGRDKVKMRQAELKRLETQVVYDESIVDALKKDGAITSA